MASEKFATDLPPDVDLSSAFCPAFPSRMTLFTPMLDMMLTSLCSRILKSSHETADWRKKCWTSEEIRIPATRRDIARCKALRSNELRLNKSSERQDVSRSIAMLIAAAI